MIKMGEIWSLSLCCSEVCLCTCIPP